MSIVRRLGLAALFVLAGCGPAPLATPGPSAVVSATPTVAPVGTASEAGAVEDLVANMASAVIAGDRDGYLALVDLSDSVFALEHTRWADDWAGPNRVRSYTAGITEVAFDADTATGRLTVTWNAGEIDEVRTAAFPVRFTRGEAGWRYAGEVWGATDTEHFQVLVQPGLEAAVTSIVPELPRVYDLVTTTLDAAPAGSMQIKVYVDPQALVANTVLSLPLIRGWNEPGEALKLFFDPDDASLTSVVAHEFTHFLCFDRAGTQRTRMPWWLDEGIAVFVARPLEAPGPDGRLAQVLEWAAAGELAEWADMTVFEETPLELWRHVYPQGYAMVTYITEQFGAERRNAWLAAMATEMTIDQATPVELGVSFDALDAGFEAWLAAR